jgi:hypothetical protein
MCTSREKDMASNPPIRTVARILIAAAALALPAALISATPARAEVVISVGFGPPALPVYAQPACPGDGYLWTPGYWAYGDDGYFWVPGTWLRPPRVGYLWTPGYWGWGGSAFIFHSGYWGEHVGFYGGIHYGFGYGGVGYDGGYWRNGAFAYNRSVNNIDIGRVRNVYDRPVAIHNEAFNHVSYNGGNGGVPYRPSAQEQAAFHEQHIRPTGEQMQHQTLAAQNRQQFAKFNGGRPGVTAAPTPGAFHNNSATARGGFANRPGEVNQQQRITNGFRSNQERPQPNREQNNASRQINRENHTAASQPRAQSHPARSGKPR